MQFNDIIGQTTIKQHLLKSVRDKRVSHAQLLLGATGYGGLALALAYAQLINCRNPQADDSCGRCGSCLRSKRMAHPDIHYSYPTIGPKALSTQFIDRWREAIAQNPYLDAFHWLQFIKAENKQGNITVEECEDIVRKLNLMPAESGFKVLVMWLPEYLGKEGNRLLKLIEEPPDNTLFLLVAENADLILNTILSRTQLLKIPRLSETDISQGLQKHRQVNADTAHQIAVLAEGNLNEALALLDGEQRNNQHLLVKWLNACMTNQTAQMDSFTEEIAEVGREGQKNFLRYALHFLRQCLMMKTAPQLAVLLPSEVSIAQRLTAQIGREHIAYLNTLLNDAVYHVERNANPRILFFNLSIKTADLLAYKPKK